MNPYPRWVYEDSATQFARFDADANQKVTKDEVLVLKYGVKDDNPSAKFKQKQDFRRFKIADSSRDGTLDSDEFCMYLHPGFQNNCYD